MCGPRALAPPHRDQRTVLRVERVVLGNRSALEQVELIEQRRGLESPVLLERERSRVAFAAAVIEYPDSALARAPHELPVLEIVGGEVARPRGVARIVRKHLVLEVEAQHTTHRFALRVEYRQYLAAIAEDGPKPREVALRQRRRAVAVNVVRVQPEETVHRGVELALEPVLHPLANHRPLLAGNGEEVCLGVGLELRREGHIQVLTRPIFTLQAPIAQLEM